MSSEGTSLTEKHIVQIVFIIYLQDRSPVTPTRGRGFDCGVEVDIMKSSETEGQVGVTMHVMLGFLIWIVFKHLAVDSGLIRYKSIE